MAQSSLTTVACLIFACKIGNSKDNILSIQWGHESIFVLDGQLKIASNA